MTRASSAAVAVVATGATAAVLRRREPRIVGWRRHNYRDRPVTIAAGPAVAAGLLAAAASASAPGALVAAATGAGLGLYDDLRGDSHARGLRGHLRALREGRVTTGMVKLTGLVAGGVAAAALDRRRAPRATSVSGTSHLVVDAMLIAGTANLVNLLDLRPGRALKAVIAVGLGATSCADAAGAVAAGLVAGAAVALPADLAEREMVGDCGANAAGAVAGWCLATGLGRVGRVVALAAVVGLTLTSERLSFTAVIERTPWLRAVDAWGRVR